MYALLSRSAKHAPSTIFPKQAFQIILQKPISEPANQSAAIITKDEKSQIALMDKELKKNVTSAWLKLRTGGKQQEALEYFNKLYNDLDTDLGRKSGLHAGLAQQLCVVNFSMGDMVAAEQHARFAMEDHLQKMGKNSVPVAMVGVRLGSALLLQGKVEEARPLLVDSYDFLMRKFDSWWSRTFGLSMAIRVGGEVVIYRAIMDLVQAKTPADVEYWKTDLFKSFRQVSMLLAATNYQLKNLDMALRQHYWVISEHLNQDDDKQNADVISALFDQHLSILHHIGKQKHMSRIFTVAMQQAIWLYSIGRYEKGVEVLKKLVQFVDVEESSLIQAKLRLGMCLIGVDKNDDAKIYLNQALQFYQNKQQQKNQIKDENSENHEVPQAQEEGQEEDQNEEDPLLTEAKIGLLLSGGVQQEGLYAIVMLSQLQQQYDDENMVVKGGQLLAQRNQQKHFQDQ